MNTNIRPHQPEDELKGKTILLVNTGSLKKRFIIQRMKKLGVNIVALNKEKNWALPYVDDWIIADTADHTKALQQVESFIKDNRETKIDGAITFWEDDVLLTAKICDKFHFIGIPHAIAKKARSKFLFRDFCKNNELPYIKHQIIKNSKDIDVVVKNLSFPLVVKPVYGSSSAYVIKINTEEALREGYEYIKKAMSEKVESALTDGGDIMVEEYIDGDEVDMDILIQHGRIKFYSISDNDKTNEPFFVETGQSIPSSLPHKNQEDLIAMADETLEKLGIQNGCVHFEAKATKTGPMPIEINLRMGGDEVHSFVKGVWRVDLIKYALIIALGLHIKKINKPQNPYKYMAGRYFLAEQSGILSQLDVNKDIENKEYIEEVNIFKKIGDSVLTPPEGYDCMGWVTVSGDNFIDAEDNLHEALGLVKFEISKFHPASTIGKTLRKNKFSFSSIRKDSSLNNTKIERLRRIDIKNQRKLHIGIINNVYADQTNGLEVEQALTSVGNNIEKTLIERGYKTTLFDFNNLDEAFNKLRHSDIDLAINICERINNSSLLEPHAAAILDTLQIPYTGSSPFTLGLCIDKIRVKKLLSYHKIPTPKWDYVYSLSDKIDGDLKYPLIVKPANTDNSIGITNESVVTNEADLKKQLHKIIVEIGRPALIEEYIDGDEYDVSILGSEEDDLRVLPLSRSIFDNLPGGYWHIYPYEAKYSDNQIYKEKIIIERPPKKINKRLESLISEIALDTYNILDCHDYGRVEIKVDAHNNPYVLELNPNPSINIGDCVPAVAQLAGLDYGDFLEEVIRMTIQRYKSKPPYYHLQGNGISL